MDACREGGMRHKAAECHLLTLHISPSLPGWFSMSPKWTETVSSDHRDQLTMTVACHHFKSHISLCLHHTLVTLRALPLRLGAARGPSNRSPSVAAKMTTALCFPAEQTSLSFMSTIYSRSKIPKTGSDLGSLRGSLR